MLLKRDLLYFISGPYSPVKKKPWTLLVRMPHILKRTLLLIPKEIETMNSVWNEETPHQRFWRQLLNKNVDDLINDPEAFLLKHMRYDNDMAKGYQKRFGASLTERGTNIYKLIAGACGEQWDSEDEQKNACAPVKKEFPCNQRNHGTHDDLDPARKSGLPEGQGRGHVVQIRTAGSGEDLEKGLRKGIKEV